MGQPRPHGQNGKQNDNNPHTVRGFDSQIRGPEHHHGKQHYHPGHTVVLPEYLCISCDKCHAECKRQKYFENIDEKMPSLFPAVFTVPDQCL